MVITELMFPITWFHSSQPPHLPAKHTTGCVALCTRRLACTLVTGQILHGKAALQTFSYQPPKSVGMISSPAQSLTSQVILNKWGRAYLCFLKMLQEAQMQWWLEILQPPTKRRQIISALAIKSNPGGYKNVKGRHSQLLFPTPNLFIGLKHFDIFMRHKRKSCQTQTYTPIWTGDKFKCHSFCCKPDAHLGTSP